MILEQKGLYHDNDDYRYNLDRLNDLNLPVGLAETVGLQAERVACLILQHYLTRKPGGWGFTEDVPTLAKKLEQRLGGTFGELEAFRNEFAPGHGTAFLVTRQLVFTAAHCICYDDSSEVNPKLVNTTRVVFGFHGAKEKRSDYFFSDDKVRTATVVAYQHFRARGKKTFYSEWSDWALLKLDQEVPWEPLPLNLEKVMNKIELYMLGHPNGLPLKFTYNGMLEGNTEHDFFECKIDAFQGNSGSPIFNATTYRVEGILIEGRKDYEVLDDKIQVRQITASKIISNPIGIRMENCQRLSSLHHLVDKDLLDSKDFEIVQNAHEIIVHSLKELYKSRNTIHRLLEQPLHIDTIYTELVLLSESKEKEKQDKKTFEEGRINSWEDIQGEKQSIALHALFENRNDKTPKRLLILGRAGIGKSTLCQYIANQWAEGKLWQEKFEAVFWIPLRKLQNVHSKEKADSVLFRLCCTVQGLFAKDVTQYLEKNRDKVLLILDGLDEINLAEDSRQKKILDQLLNFPYWIVTSRPHAAGGIRPDDTIENVGYASKTIELYIQKSLQNNSLAVVQKLHQNPILFGFCHIPINLELICTILKKSKGDLSKINSMTSLYEELTFTLQKRFLEKIGKPYVWGWTQKKLEENQEVKNDLAVFELLEAIAWTGMQDRQLIFSLDSEKMEKILEEFSDVNLDHICISGFLQSTQDSNDVFANEYSFLHLTFQEFFAARYLVRLLANDLTKAAQLIREVKFDPRYKVVMWFVAGLLRNEGGNWFKLNAFFEVLDTPKDLIGLYGSLLKVRCLEECSWQEKVQNIKAHKEEIQVWVNWMEKGLSKDFHITKYLLETFEISSQGAKLLLIPQLISLMSSKGNAVEVIGQLGLNDPLAVIPALLIALKHESRWIREEAAKALGQVGQTDPLSVIPALRLALKDKESDVRGAAAGAFEKIGQADPLTIIPALLQASKDEDWTVRNAVAKSLGEVSKTAPKIAIPIFLSFFKDENDEIRELAIDVLGKIGQDAPPTVIPVLLLALKDEKQGVRKAAALALMKIGQNDPLTVIPALLQACKDEDWLVRAFANEALGKVSEADPLTAIPMLLLVINDENKKIRDPAVSSLRKACQANPLTVIPVLLQALKNENKEVRCVAAHLLEKIGQADPLTVIPKLLLALKDEDSNVREAAAQAIGQVGQVAPLKVVPSLHQAFKDESIGVRCKAAIALGEIAHADLLKVIPTLLQAFKDDWPWAKSNTAKTLGKINQATSPIAISSLLRVLEYKNEEVKRALTMALKHIDFAQADPLTIIPELLQALKDKEEGVRSSAADALGQVGQADPLMVTPSLHQALNDEDDWVRNAAAFALVNVNRADPLTVPALLLALKGEYKWNRIKAIKALRKVYQIYPLTAIPALFQALKDKDRDVRDISGSVLVKIGRVNPLIVTPALLLALSDEDEWIRSTVANALTKMDLTQTDPLTVIPALLLALKDESEGVRSAVAEILGQVGQFDPLTVIPALLLALKDESGKVRKAVATTLKQMDLTKADPLTVLPALLLAFKDENMCVRSAITEAFEQVGQFDPLAVIPALLVAFREEEFNASKTVAKALEQACQANPLKVIPALFAIIKDKNREWIYIRASEKAILSKYDLAPYLKSNSYILKHKDILSFTPLVSLINCYNEDPSQSSLYSAAIIKKCIEENRPLFLEENSLCFYEQSKFFKIEIFQIVQFRIQIEKHVPQYPEFTLEQTETPTAQKEEKCSIQ